MRTYSDEELVEKVLQGDEGAFAELYERYHKRLEFVAYRLCKNSEDAKDAVQQTFLQIHTSLHTLREPKRFYHWCCKIIHGKCTDMFRKNRDIYLDVDHSPLVSAMVEEREDFLPQNQMHFASDREVLLNMLDQLPLVQRQVVMMVYFDQLSMQDCATILNVPEGTVKSRLFTAKKTLREMIKDYNEQNETPLNFKATTMEAMITAVLLKEYGAFSNHALLGATTKTQHFSPRGKAFTATAITFALVCVGIGYHYNQNHEEAPVTAKAPLQYQGRDIHNSQEAYFILRNWAVNEKQMQNRDTQEVTAIKALYEYLKQNDDAYYDILQQDGWDVAFEALLP